MERQKLKLPKKRCKLGDIAQLIGVKKFILREWEKQFGMTRDCDQEEHGYTQHHLDQFGYIKALIYDDGNSIKKAQVIFAEKFAITLAVPVEAETAELATPTTTEETTEVAAAPEAVAAEVAPAVTLQAEAVEVAPVTEAAPETVTCTTSEVAPAPAETVTEVVPALETTPVAVTPALEAVSETVTCTTPETTTAPAETASVETAPITAPTATFEPTFMASKPAPHSEAHNITGAVRACVLPPPTTIELTACEAPADPQQEILAALRNDLETLKHQLSALQKQLNPASRPAAAKDQPSAPC